MDRKTIEDKLARYGQMQLLKFYDELDARGQQSLLNDISRIDFDLVDINRGNENAGKISPLDALTLSEIAESKDRFYEIGIDAIKQCKAAAVLLAGGQGTRLGIDGPKGTLNVGLTRQLFIFECLINNLLEVTNAAGAMIPLLIMTSDKNDEATRAFFEEHSYFGYDKEYVFFFVQEMAPSTDFDGKIYLEEKDKVSLSPNGNGGWFVSLQKAGLLDKVKEMGVEWLNVFAVDNVLQKMCDPLFLGAVIDSGEPIGSKVVSKAAPDEKVGVMCLRDGRPSIVEYYELTPEMMEEKNFAGDLSYNYGVILNYLFRIDALEEVADKDMPLHIVKKKIPHIDNEGNPVKPEEPNGFKFETLVLDMIEMMDGCLVFEVDRSKEFAPIKNMHGVDSLDTARKALEANGVRL